MNAFTELTSVKEATDKIKTISAIPGFTVSDIKDAKGLQYVDFVMEGGGVLGIALLGYAYGLEQAGIRFLGLGGTSAGSIVALILAACGSVEEEKAAKAVDVLAEMPMAEFMDGDGDARDFSNAMLKKSSLWKLLAKGLQCVDNMQHDLGLHPGKVFYDWMNQTLANYGVKSVADLRNTMSKMPPGLVYNNEPAKIGEFENRLVIVAADVSTQTKVEFPRMAPMYWADTDALAPAHFARASMSVPFFFSPMKVNVPPTPTVKEAWERLASYKNDLPESATFLDGGIMSNFPINAFHTPFCVPRKPTFGAKLGFDREPVKIDSPAALLSNIFDSARHTLDFDFVVKNPDYCQLVSYIDVEKKYNWLDFAMPPEMQQELFAAGVQAAADFLCGNPAKKMKGFDWSAYKKLREALAKQNQEA